MWLLAVLVSQGIMVKCRATSFFHTMDQIKLEGSRQIPLKLFSYCISDFKIWPKFFSLVGFLWHLKGKYHANLLSFQTQKCLSVSRNKEVIVKFVINYHPSAIKLSISASGQKQSRPVWIET